MIYNSVNEDNRDDFVDFVKANWGSNTIISNGVIHDIRLLDGFIAVEDGEVLGGITYSISDDECEIGSCQRKL